MTYLLKNLMEFQLSQNLRQLKLRVIVSLKDLGKKLFAFSRMEEMTADELLSRINI